MYAFSPLKLLVVSFRDLFVLYGPLHSTFKTKQEFKKTMILNEMMITSIQTFENETFLPMKLFLSYNRPFYSYPSL